MGIGNHEIHEMHERNRILDIKFNDKISEYFSCVLCVSWLNKKVCDGCFGTTKCTKYTKGIGIRTKNNSKYFQFFVCFVCFVVK